MKPHHAATVFQVANLAAALRHYTEVLGFTEDFRFGDYAGIKLGGVRLHLSGQRVYGQPVGGGTVYFFCDEIDAYYADIKARGAVLKSSPENQPYGMRDFMANDLDGNHLAFGCELETE